MLHRDSKNKDQGQVRKVGSINMCHLCKSVYIHKFPLVQYYGTLNITRTSTLFIHVI